MYLTTKPRLLKTKTQIKLMKTDANNKKINEKLFERAANNKK